MLPRVASRAIACAAVLCVSCSSDPWGQSSSQVIVTGPGVPPTQGAEQAETGTSVQTFSGYAPIVDTTYNDETGEIPQYVQYPPGDRLVYAGYSLLGLSVSTDGGNTFVYNPFPKLRAPPGWDVLWGDPSITHNVYDQHYVYIANLAVSHPSFPYVGNTDKKTGGAGQGFIEGSVLWDNTQGICTSPTQLCSYIDGACVARSTDAGNTFQPLQPTDCFQNTDGGFAHFYDGSSITTDWNGGVYAAFNDVSMDTEDVWYAPSPTAPLARLPSQPFAGLQMVSHPLLRHDYSTNRVYIMALAGPESNVGYGDFLRTTARLWIDYWDGTSWHGPVSLWHNVLNNPWIQRGVDPNNIPMNVRTGLSFSFDIGTASINGNDDVRIVATLPRANGLAELAAAICMRDLTGCQPVSEWTTSAFPGEQFNPSLIAQPGWPGVIAPVWKVSYNTTELDVNGTTLSVVDTSLQVESNGAHYPWTWSPMVTNTPLCPDTRTVKINFSQVVEGYWGDYDDLQILSTDPAAGTTFIRTHTDSTASTTCARDTFRSSPVHVSAHTCQ